MFQNVELRKLCIHTLAVGEKQGINHYYRYIVMNNILSNIFLTDVEIHDGRLIGKGAV
jgi:hypothetical protein